MPSTVLSLQTCRMAKARRKTKAPNYFQAWRKKLGLTQDQAADRSGLSQGTITKLENGKIGWTQGNLEALAHAYGCEPPDLLRPPVTPENELAAFIMGLDKKAQARALKLIRALEDESDVA